VSEAVLGEKGRKSTVGVKRFAHILLFMSHPPIAVRIDALRADRYA